MARPSKHDGVVYRRKESNIWWMRYRDKSGCRRLDLGGRAKPANEGRVKTGQRRVHSGH